MTLAFDCLNGVCTQNDMIVQLQDSLALRKPSKSGVMGVGDWGGQCLCPNGGGLYFAGNKDRTDTTCDALACDGEMVGACNKYAGEWSGVKVTCPTSADDKYKNTAIENADGVGQNGGYCTCPDGQMYPVGTFGGNSSTCGTLACIGQGAQMGSCNIGYSSTWSYKQVNCGQPRPEETQACDDKAKKVCKATGKCSEVNCKPIKDESSSSSSSRIPGRGSDKKDKDTCDTNAKLKCKKSGDCSASDCSPISEDSSSSSSSRIPGRGSGNASSNCPRSCGRADKAKCKKTGNCDPDTCCKMNLILDDVNLGLNSDGIYW